MRRAAMTFLSFLSLWTVSAFAETDKGLLPEIRLNDNENENQHKAYSSEVLITRSENKAIDSLLSIIKSKKGTEAEPELWYRLAELYMRRSKSGRFFDLNRDSAMIKHSTFPVPNENGVASVKKAIKIYTKIENDFPRFNQMDSVLFNNGFAHQQVGELQKAQDHYVHLTQKFHGSNLIPDGTLALAEILYDQGKFTSALEEYKKLESFPDSRGYSYGMYKAAWAYYNLHDTAQGMKKLIAVVKSNPPLVEGEVPTNKHNLRQEALRDLALFAADIESADQIYSFFEKITSEDELGKTMMNLAKLYDSHSRQKEMNIFLYEFIQKKPLSADVVSAHLALIEANENLKNRDRVVDHFQQVAELCRADSSWRALHNPDHFQSSCLEEFHRTSIELTKKWFEIWSKNKLNQEFSNLTQKLFKLILDNEDPSKPDLKIRYAYAEMLFQLKKYDEASTEYSWVGTKCEVQTSASICHDANYAALFSKEKSIELEKSAVKTAELKKLAIHYLNKHPQGLYESSVKFKLGLIAYQENNYAEAETRLSPLSQLLGNENAQIRQQAEDLLLDILNIKKDYAGIQHLAQKISDASADKERKSAMSQIIQETQYSEIQSHNPNQNPEQRAQELLDYTKKYPKSKLSQEALWQAIGINFASGKGLIAAELSTLYADKYPHDPRNVDALKDAAKAYSESGKILMSAETLLKLSSVDSKNKNLHLEKAADLFSTEKKLIQTRSAYLQILEKPNAINPDITIRIYGKLLDTYKNEPHAKELEKLKEQIQEKSLEPYTTQFLTEKAQKLYDAGNLHAAFDLSMKIINRHSPTESRAGARLIQALVLEKELTQQSLKASESKFTLVLGLKTEKLDKAQSAYLAALKMSKDPHQQVQVLKGMDRCYTNYIETVKKMPLPASLKPEEQQQLKTELEKIVVPIEKKKIENENKLKEFENLQPLAAN